MSHTDDITQLSAVELAALIRARRISCREVTGAFLNKIETHNPTINAICTLDADRALDTADALDRDIAAGLGAGRSLMGLPIVLKDLTPTAGIRTTRGSRLFENWIPSEDAALVTRLKDQGAIVLGKTNTPEFGHKAVTDNAIFGPTANPWRLDRIAGGSSGGSAAAVAAALVPFAEGSDGAGSIRIPASICGTVGFKPTFGRVPDVAQSFFSHTPYFHNGPIARSVADADLLYRAMLGPTAGGIFSLPVEQPNGLAQKPLCDIRVGFSPDLGLFPVRADVARACRKSAEVFATLGCQVVEADLTLPPDTEAAFLDLWRAKVAGLYGELGAGDLDLLEPVVQTLIEEGRAIDMVRFGKALKTRDRVWQAMTALFDKVDILLCPTTCVTAFAQSGGPPSDISGQPVNPLIGWFLTYPMNMTGHPVISVPCGLCDEGLPVGLQIAGRRLEDDLVLGLAAHFEAAHPWPKIAPL
ncbi:aspartyl-tRNA(Asn)/glutamyl-tRNA(Gln) amidotransferase subunit A [Roseovarius litoreus]|uniref:Aspartyl-tRNA(Asn)/glutamyl-tRNA(Gln) amidotransferase subunit A n=1 Tax=Roseovarius litoreus TaxID=1155722 RepID=A0A1M7EFY3_9RHOB|nr:amidase [Roseovarius litoreus]SHL90634.1 aspartyl-tRNA(Asn)/glutamyl-tRNA(Gln) amidotransferase subunit A [Roseovarius litoreus]